MGYTTYFDGGIKLDKPLTEEHKSILQNFQQADHRDEKGMPGIWCQWEPSKDGTEIVHDQGEKFYDYVEWMKYLMDKFITPWGYKANGAITWDGEESDDDGVLEVTDNAVSSYNTHERAHEVEEGLVKVLSLLPDQLPLLMGINDTVDAKVKKILAAGAAPEPNKVDEVLDLLNNM